MKLLDSSFFSKHLLASVRGKVLFSGRAKGHVFQVWGSCNTNNISNGSDNSSSRNSSNVRNIRSKARECESGIAVRVCCMYCVRSISHYMHGIHRLCVQILNPMPFELYPK